MRLRSMGSIHCGDFLHERSKSNDDLTCSLALVSDAIERPSHFFQIWRFGAQPFKPRLCIKDIRRDRIDDRAVAMHQLRRLQRRSPIRSAHSSFRPLNGCRAQAPAYRLIHSLTPPYCSNRRRSFGRRGPALARVRRRIGTNYWFSHDRTTDHSNGQRPLRHHLDQVGAIIRRTVRIAQQAVG
jgi:hypothetical protein